MRTKLTAPATISKLKVILHGKPFVELTDLPLNTLVLDVQQILEEDKGIPAEYQELYLRGKALKKTTLSIA